MTKERAKEMWNEWKWWLALVVFPLVVWGARSFDDSKVSTRRFERYTDSLAAVTLLKERTDSLHHIVDDRKLDYLACRQDFSRKQCLRPDRP
jgi:hypothetical protein